MVKILFIGSNPNDQSTLTFERDITALQIRVLGSRGLGAEFIFMPSCPVEDLPAHLANVRPDIVHFAAHGGDGNLTLADSMGRECRIDADMIKNFLDPDEPPRLVYLSACDSGAIAEALRTLGVASIAATAPITNQAARGAALCFYDRVLRGFTIGAAHSAASSILQSLNLLDVRSKLYEPVSVTGVSIADMVLFRVPRIIAEPVGRIGRGANSIAVRIGLMDFPRKSTRAVFFTADRSFFDESEADWGIFHADPDDYAGRVCWSDVWTIGGDFTVIAVAASSNEMTFSGQSTVCAALRACNRYRPRGCTAHGKDVEQAIERLDYLAPETALELSTAVSEAATAPAKRSTKSAST